MTDTTKVGTVFVREGTAVPGAARFESEPYASGWRIVPNLDGQGLDRQIHAAGWTFFCLAGEMNVSVFGLDEQETVRRAVERILADSRSENFNSLEILRVASKASKRFLGVCYVTVSARPRHIQESISLFGLRTFRSGAEQSWPPEPKHEASKAKEQAKVRNDLTARRGQ